MLRLTEDARQKSLLTQGFRQGGHIRLNLREAKRPTIVWVAPSHPNRPRWLTDCNRYMSMLKTQALLRQPVHIRSRTRNLGTIDSHGISIHIVQSDEHYIQLLLGPQADRGEEKEGGCYTDHYGHWTTTDAFALASAIRVSITQPRLYLG